MGFSNTHLHIDHYLGSEFMSSNSLEPYTKMMLLVAKKEQEHGWNAGYQDKADHYPLDLKVRDRYNIDRIIGHWEAEYKPHYTYNACMNISKRLNKSIIPR